MTGDEMATLWRRAAEANDRLAEQETDDMRLKEHLDAAAWCRLVADRIEKGEQTWPA